MLQTCRFNWLKGIHLALALFVALPGFVLAQQERTQALQNLTSDEPQTRALAVFALAKVGQMQDTPELVKRLKDQNEEVAVAANNTLWVIWSRAGDKVIDALFAKGVEQMASPDKAQAIATFTKIIAMKPDFAEAWNKRATVYFLNENYQKSISDCDAVLKLNPNHFGALSGLGQIYMRLGTPAKALGYFERAYEINPILEGMEELIQSVREGLKRSSAE
jgi:tetratricopeptide (TPR) repeat protein